MSWRPAGPPARDISKGAVAARLKKCWYESPRACSCCSVGTRPMSLGWVLPLGRAPSHARSICSWRMSMPSALSRASFILLAVLLLCPVAAGATLREITSEDIASWREIREGALSADGKWLAYQLTPDEGSQSEKRRVGKEWVRTCRSRGSPYH